jgi:hypothetical protein
MAARLAMALDAVQLARRAGIEPDAWQAELLRSDAPQMLMLCARQSGKSTVSALIAVHEALCSAPALVLVLAPSLRQSAELCRKVRGILSALGEDVPALTQESALTLELANGSRIVSLPGSSDATIRGYSGVRLLVIDEAARVRDDLYSAVRPMLAVSRGRIVALSTPFGKRGWFHHEWTAGGDSWHRVKVTADECPRIDPAWLAEEKARIGALWYASEYACEFIETDDSVFSYDSVMNALSDAVMPFFGGGAGGAFDVEGAA